MTDHAPHPHEPLNREERALAQRLARLGPHAEPSPDLDARILAAARAIHDPAPETAPAPPAQPRNRWPMALGIAASLALAIGLSWQLRPLVDPPATRDAANVATEASAEQASTRRAESMARRSTTDDRADDAVAAAAAASKPVPTPTTVPEPARDQESAESAPAVVAAPADRTSTRQATADALPEPPSAAEATAAPQAFSRTKTAQLVESTASTEQIDAGIPKVQPAPAMQAAPEQRAAATVGVDALQLPTKLADKARAPAQQSIASQRTDYPDNAQGRRDWLRDIRTLRDDGQLDAARTLLRAFRERYPDYPLADDLQALAR